MNPLKHVSIGFLQAIGIAIGAALLGILGYYTTPVRNMLVVFWTKKIELELGVLTTIVLLLLVIACALYLGYRNSCREAWDRILSLTLSAAEREKIERCKRMNLDEFDQDQRIADFKERTKRFKNPITGTNQSNPQGSNQSSETTD